MKRLRFEIITSFILVLILNSCDKAQNSSREEEKNKAPPQSQTMGVEMDAGVNTNSIMPSGKNSHQLEEVIRYLKSERGHEFSVNDPNSWRPAGSSKWLKGEIARKKFSIGKLGLKKPKVGIESGKVGICGYLLARPYRLTCTPISADSIERQYGLFVNGVRLDTTCQSFFVEAAAGKAVKDSGISSEQSRIVYGRLRDLRAKIESLPASTKSSDVEGIVEAEIDSIRKLPYIERIGLKTISDGRKLFSFHIIFGLKSQEPAIGFGFDIPMPGLGRKKNTGRISILPKKSCEYLKQEVVQALKTNGFVQQGPVVKNNGEEIVGHIKMVMASGVDDAVKYWLLLKLGAMCPVCYLANN